MRAALELLGAMTLFVMMAVALYAAGEHGWAYVPLTMASGFAGAGVTTWLLSREAGDGTDNEAAKRAPE